MIDMTTISKVPVVMFVGMQDDLAPPSDTRWARDQVKTTVHYEEIDNFDHASFVLGKNTSYVDTALTWAEKYDPIHHHKKKAAEVSMINLWLY
jgi:cephalosporin-C deacetylase-like acetyl esterase